MAKKFPQKKEYELALLLDSDPQRLKLKGYIDQYIILVLRRFEMTEEKYQALYRALHNDIPIAADRYLKSEARLADYKFSTYFSWYVAKRINSSKGIKRRKNGKNPGEHTM